MRRTLFTGLVLAVVAALLMSLSRQLDLGLESVVLLGGALGAVVGLVPDRTAWTRLGGFAAGFVVAWLGYVARAALLPDTGTGRAVAVFLVLLACTAVAAATRGRLPLWTLLLGTAGLSGAYELTFSAAPPELVSTSVSTATTLFLAVAVGFCIAAVAPQASPAATPLQAGPAGPAVPGQRQQSDHADVHAPADNAGLEIMEKSK